MIKVLHTLPDLHIGGVASLLLKLYKSFNNSSYEHHLCYFGKNEALLKDFETENIQIHKIPYFGISSILTTCYQFRKLVKTENFNIIHSNLFLDRIIVGISSFNLKIPVIVSVHTTNSYSQNTSWKSKSFLLLEDILGRITTSHFIAVSDTVKEIAIKERKIKRDKIITIHSGVDMPEIINKNINKWEEINIVAIGRLIRSKNFDHLLKILKILISDNLKVKLTILGDGPLKNKLENLSFDLNINDHVHFHGFTSNVSAFLKKSDLFISCSTEEGFGLSVVEAMAYSLPVVTYDIPIFREISDEGKFFPLVQLGNFEEFALKIENLISSPLEYELFSKKGRKRSEEKFDIAKSASSYLALYSKISLNRGIAEKHIDRKC